MAHYRQRGYHRLAQLMSHDSNLAIFRRFDEMNALSLLYLQSEIMQLEADFRHQCSIDNQTQGDTQIYGTEFAKLLEAGVDSDQFQLLDDLVSKLRVYNEMLLQVSRTAAIPTAIPSQLQTLRGWLQKPNGGDNFLKSVEARTWESEPGVSFVNVSTSDAENDTFSRFVSWLMTRGLMRCLCARAGTVIDEATKMKSFSDSRINAFCTVVVTVLSSILPLVSILVLYYIKTPVARIGVTIAFTAVFATVLAVFSKAKRVEILAATATFAAVEVVFIGSALN